MKELDRFEEKFYSKWEKHRKNKWLFAFKQGSVYWGVPMGIMVFLFQNDFDIEKMQLSSLLQCVIWFGIGGVLVGLNRFKQIDKVYLELNDNDEIAKGIQTLNAGDIWNYENLKINRKDDETLIIQNDIFWFDEKIFPLRIFMNA